MSDEQAVCNLCGEPMPQGETMFKYHGYSGPCPKPPLPKATPKLPINEKFELYVDDEGDYILHMKDRPQHFITSHGATPNQAVEVMLELIHELEEMNKKQ